MQACVEVWESDPGGVPLQLGRLHRAGRAGAGVGSHRDVRAPGADRLPLRARHGRGRGRRAHEGALPGLARARASPICLHEHQGGFAFNVESVLGLRDKCVSEGVPCSRASRSPGSRHATTTRSRRRDERGRHRGRRAGRDRAGTVGRALLGDARHAGHDRHHALRRATSFATVRCGRTGTSRRARSRSTR